MKRTIKKDAPWGECIVCGRRAEKKNDEGWACKNHFDWVNLQPPADEKPPKPCKKCNGFGKVHIKGEDGVEVIPCPDCSGKK